MSCCFSSSPSVLHKSLAIWTRRSNSASSAMRAFISTFRFDASAIFRRLVQKNLREGKISHLQNGRLDEKCVLSINMRTWIDVYWMNCNRQLIAYEQRQLYTCEGCSKSANDFAPNPNNEWERWQFARSFDISILTRNRFNFLTALKPPSNKYTQIVWSQQNPFKFISHFLRFICTMYAIRLSWYRLQICLRSAHFKRFQAKPHARVSLNKKNSVSGMFSQLVGDSRIFRRKCRKYSIYYVLDWVEWKSQKKKTFSNCIEFVDIKRSCSHITHDREKI